MNVLKKPAESFWWALFAGYAVFLFIACTIPAHRLPLVIFYANDKILHFFSFLLLALLGFRAACFSPRPLFSSYGDGKITGFSFLYGALIEWVQCFIPGRQGSFGDFAADGVGTVLALVLFRLSTSWQN